MKGRIIIIVWSYFVWARKVKKNVKQNIYPTILLRLIGPMKVWTVMFQFLTVKGPYPWWPCSIFSTKKKYGTSTVLLFQKVLFTKQSLCWLEARCPFIVWVSLEFFFCNLVVSFIFYQLCRGFCGEPCWHLSMNFLGFGYSRDTLTSPNISGERLSTAKELIFFDNV